MLKNKNLAVALTLAGVAALTLVSLAGAQTSTSTTPTPGSTSHQMTVQIGPAGNALLRGTLVSVNGTASLTITSWGGNWTVNVSNNTQVMPRITGSASDISSFTAGDYVGVQGTVNANSPWTIDAKIARDWSSHQTQKSNAQSVKQTEQAGRQAGVGKIFTGTASNVSGSSFTLTSEGTTYTVQIAANAKVLNRNWLTITVSSVQNGDNIRVFGTASGTTITASVVRDTSLPAPASH